MISPSTFWNLCKILFSALFFAVYDTRRFGYPLNITNKARIDSALLKSDLVLFRNGKSFIFVYVDFHTGVRRDTEKNT